MHRRPRNKIIKLCACVLLFAAGGAIVNVAVAWGCAQWGLHEATRPRDFSPNDAEMAWWARNGLSRKAELRLVMRHAGIGTNWDVFQGENTFILLRDVAGLPMRCLEGYAYKDHIRGKLNIGLPRSVPISPIWPGFAINTVFYAAVLWLVFAAPGWVRRRLRARRGQCPACAYPIGTSDVCTECGRPVTSRA